MELDCSGGDFAPKALFHEFPRIRRDDGGIVGGCCHTGPEFLCDVIVGHDADVPSDFKASVAAEAIEETEGSSPWDDYDFRGVLQGKHRFNGHWSVLRPQCAESPPPPTGRASPCPCDSNSSKRSPTTCARRYQNAGGCGMIRNYSATSCVLELAF